MLQIIMIDKSVLYTYWYKKKLIDLVVVVATPIERCYFLSLLVQE